jgi:hypothetical protein
MTCRETGDGRFIGFESFGARRGLGGAGAASFDFGRRAPAGASVVAVPDQHSAARRRLEYFTDIRSGGSNRGASLWAEHASMISHR